MQKDLEKAVLDIEEDLYNIFGDDSVQIFLTSNSYYESVGLVLCVDEYSPVVNIQIYNSENNDRKYYEENDCDEDFNTLLRRRINTVATNLIKICTDLDLKGLV